MRSILPKGENRKRRSIAARVIACVLVALLALPFAGCSACPNATGATAGSQEYTVSVSLSGGSGRASIASPTTIVKDGDTYTATITWSSSNYDKMTVDGVDYAPVNDGGNSTFEIPVTLDEDIAVDDLLAGRRSGESKASLQRWLRSRPRAARKPVRSTTAARQPSIPKARRG